MPTTKPDSAQVHALSLHFVLLKSVQPLPLHWLNHSELQWLHGKSAKRTQSFVWSRALLRQLCCQLLNVTQQQVVISLPAEQKPELWVAGTKYHCSVSHSKDMVAVVLSSIGAVGLDVEYICPQRDKQPYATLYPALRNYCVSDQQFYQRWTALEATLKLSGGDLFALLAQPEPELAPELKCWQQLGYQFCVASQQHLTSLQQQQVLQLP
ncbi:MAG TPA: hypothetical protein DF774_00400 [Rheinheimera sp.]|uniref:4'-phosphopantetheinyl transferase family protein n=1 Tax=Rheinheimera sp. TaxID=1869214 RepID=UPI000EC3253F|nr:hypothetical protein [Rheinheimera sp.]HCU64198.1 hypothetical protein [Rheinheimera sp.]